MRASVGEPIAFLRRVVEAERRRGCIEWPFGKEDGYGRLVYQGRARLAHQIALELDGRPVPFSHAEARHLCANRGCVNPAHLTWGTRSDNQRDRFRLHGDSMRGDRNPRSKLTADDVGRIRERLRCGERQSAIAADFGISQSAVSMIKTGSCWRAD